jgi:hypothetical protein
LSLLNFIELEIKRKPNHSLVMKKFGILVNGDYSKIKFRKKLAETVKLVKNPSYM